jgi:nitrogen fixation-related uncharacterized protein
MQLAETNGCALGVSVIIEALGRALLFWGMYEQKYCG